MMRVLGIAIAAGWLAICARPVGEYFLLRPKLGDVARRIFVDLDSGRAAEVYDHATRAFRERAARETFVAAQRVFAADRGRLGEVQDPKGFRSPGLFGGGDREVVVPLFYENGASWAHVSFRHEGGEWRMSALRIMTPLE